MRVSTTSPAPAPVAAAGSGSVAQMQAHARVLADGSGASEADKLAAYRSIRSLMSNSDWYQASTQAERDAVNAAAFGSEFVRKLDAKATRFSSELNGMGRSRTDGAYGWLKAFDKLSGADQELVAVGMGWLRDGETVADVRARLKESGDRQAQAEAAEKASGQEAPGKPGAKAVGPAPSLLDAPGYDSLAATALKMLQEAAERRSQASAASDERSEPRRAKPAERGLGEFVDTVA